MPDVTMCSGHGCNNKETCCRYMAVASKERQSYFIQPPFEHGDIQSCEYYIPMNRGVYYDQETSVSVV